jgi:hypothetical protein
MSQGFKLSPNNIKELDNVSNVETVNRYGYQGLGSDLAENEKQSMGGNSNYKGAS